MIVDCQERWLDGESEADNKNFRDRTKVGERKEKILVGLCSA